MVQSLKWGKDCLSSRQCCWMHPGADLACAWAAQGCTSAKVQADVAQLLKRGTIHLLPAASLG